MTSSSSVNNIFFSVGENSHLLRKPYTVAFLNEIPSHGIEISIHFFPLYFDGFPEGSWELPGQTGVPQWTWTGRTAGAAGSSQPGTVWWDPPTARGPSGLCTAVWWCWWGRPAAPWPAAPPRCAPGRTPGWGTSWRASQPPVSAPPSPAPDTPAVWPAAGVVGACTSPLSTLHCLTWNSRLDFSFLRRLLFSWHQASTWVSSPRPRLSSTSRAVRNTCNVSIKSNFCKVRISSSFFPLWLMLPPHHNHQKALNFSKSLFISSSEKSN